MVADAVFGQPQHRAAIEDVARDAGVAFIGLWLDVPKAVRMERGRQRRRDASDAGPDIIAAMMDDDVGDIGWRRLDGATRADDIAAAARRMIAVTCSGSLRNS